MQEAKSRNLYDTCGNLSGYSGRSLMILVIWRIEDE
jgi:hypothetical protein